MIINKLQEYSVRFMELDLRLSAFIYRQFYMVVSRITFVANIKTIWNKKNRVAKARI
jgi:hypothetical protein